MSELGAAISGFFANENISRVIGLFLWSAISLMLLPSLGRCLAKRPRYIDPLLCAALILTLNRVAFGVQVYVRSDLLADCCRWSGICGATFYLFVVWDYLRAERV